MYGVVSIVFEAKSDHFGRYNQRKDMNCRQNNYFIIILLGNKKVYWPPGPPASLSSRLDSTASNNTATGTST